MAKFYVPGVSFGWKDQKRTTLYRTSVIKTTVESLNLECVKPQRAGVIMYTVHNDMVYVGMGIDMKTHDLTDFGGGISYKKDRDVITGALREFHEETLGIFRKLNYDDISSSAVLYDDIYNLIVFIYIDVDPNIISERFLTSFTTAAKAEICGIEWLTWEDFQKHINTPGIIFSRVQKFLKRAGDFSYLL